MGQLVLVEPDGAAHGLPHLRAVGIGEQRRGEAEHLRPVDPAGEFDAVDDIAPLVRSAHLQAAGRAARQLQKIIGLEDHIVELKEAQRLFTVEAQLHAVEAQHPVDREMLADVAQERDIFQAVQPFGIVEQTSVRRPVAEGQEAFEHAFDAGDILRDEVGRQQLARFVLEAGIPDLAGAAAHQHDRLVACLLQLAQHHDRHQMADMERGRGGIEADIARHHLFRGEGVEPLGIGQLVDIAARFQKAQEIGLIVAHGARL